MWTIPVVLAVRESLTVPVVPIRANNGAIPCVRFASCAVSRNLEGEAMELCSRGQDRPTWPIGWVCASLCLVCFSGGGCTCWPPSASGDACPLQPCCTTSCGDSSDWVFPEKADLGYTIVFPGIWGIQVPDRWIVQGLVQAQTPSAIELYDWTAGPLLLFYNLCALERNRRAAQTIARKIMAYQDRYPGRPVNLVGYSGGAAMAVLVLEALPPDRKVSSTVLLGVPLCRITT